MTTRRTLLLLACLLAAVSIQAQPSFGLSRPFNDGWRFLLDDDTAAVNSRYDDSGWQRVQLPHDWSVTQPMSPHGGSCQGFLPGGIGWYRCHFTPTTEDTAEGRRLYIYFEGVYNRSTVYINGHCIGYRPSGFASFLYDLTPFLYPCQDNVLAVRVDHSRENDSRWYTGSGIYRPVWLVRAPQVHLALWGSSCTLLDISRTKANVEVSVETNQPSAHSAEITVLDHAGNAVAKTTVRMGGQQKKAARLSISQPQRWTLERPYLYKVVTRLMDGTSAIDQSEIPLGLRTLDFSPDKGFALNGVWTKVKGVCVHDDAGVLGTAVPRDVWHLRLQQLKNLGANAIRMSHNPHAPIVYALCDTIGLLVMDEASDEWEYPKRKWLKGWNRGKPGFDGTYDYFEEWIDRDVADMVRRDRQHPSVFLWSIGNEVDYPNDPYSHPVLNGDSSMTQPVYGGYKPDQPWAERIGEIAKRLAAVVRGIDTSRPVTGALAGVVMSNETAYPQAVDVVGYNYTESRYKQDHERYPKRIIYGSENRHDLAAWKAVRDNPHIFGQFLWTGIDYLGESGPWPARGSEAGLIDLAGHVKPLGHYRAALWSTEPVCYIGTYPAARPNNRNYRGREQREWVSPWAAPTWNYTEGQRIRVVCYTNATDARLLLNEHPVGGAPRRDETTDILYWDIDYQPGTLRCQAGEASAEIHTCSHPHAMRVTSSRTHLDSPDETAVIEVEVVDEQGHLVTLADNQITCFVQGGARLLGMENGDIRDLRDKTANTCRVKNGRLVAYIARRNHQDPQRRERFGTSQPAEGNPIRVIFSSPMLKSVELTF